jgi:Carboxypeptidase regulatory-like domain
MLSLLSRRQLLPFLYGGTSVQRSFRLAALAAGAASLLAAGVAATPAIASAAGVPGHASHSTSAVHLPISARQLLADRQLHNRADAATGSVTGQAVSPSGQPLRDVCVSAYGPGGVRSAVTRPDGQFLVSGLPPGSYRLRYSGCGDSAQYQAQWYGGAAQQSSARPVMVAAAGLAPVAPVTMRTLAEQSGVADVISPVSPAAAARSLQEDLGLPVYGASAAASMPKPAVVQSAKGGHISGVVTSPAGRGLKGICVEALSPSSNAFGFAVTGKTGRYRTSRVQAGSYDVIFIAGCGNTGSWLVQVYKDHETLKRPTTVAVRRGKTTSGIDATLRPGGEISGTITGKAGAKLSRVCVAPIGPPGRLYLGAESVRGGVYHLRGLPAGTYRIEYAPCAQSLAAYAPAWWHNSQFQSRAQKLKVNAGQRRTGINEVLPIGGVISGTVTDTDNAAVKGICVFALPASENGGGIFSVGFGGGPSPPSTNSAGHYTLTGLATGSYQIQFSLGCPNNGNYVAADYPENVFVRDGQTKTGVDETLQIGATISGVVTSAATGKPLPGICVEVQDESANSYYFEAARSGSGGGYRLNQVPTGSYLVWFSGGCGNTGSYAPRAYGNTSVFAPQPIKVTTPGQAVTGIGAAMQPGATITGAVTSSGGRKLSGICVYAEVLGGQGGEANSADGHYWLGNLPPGQYDLSFSTGCGDNADLAGVSYGSPANPPAVSAPAGTTTGINAVLPAAGAISGAVLSASGRPVNNACVSVTGLTSGTLVSSGDGTENSGSGYELTGLVPGRYQVMFQPDCGSNSPYENQWFSGRPSPAGAARVEVRAGHLTRRITSALVRGGSIAGTVSNDGKPLPAACVFAQSVSQLANYGEAATNRAGNYVLRGLNSGTYELEAYPCGRGSAVLAGRILTRLVKVQAPRRVNGVNTSLQAAGEISGAVLGGSPAAAQAGICAEAFEVNGYGASLAISGANGKFEIRNLSPGKYDVYLGDPGCSGGDPELAPEWYPGQPSPTSASVVRVRADAVTALSSVTLPTDGAISGSVSGPGGGTVAGICATATLASGSAGLGGQPVVAVTRHSGYSLLDLVPGKYRVEFTSGCGASGYKTQWWKAKSSAGLATLITVTAATTTTDITAALQK